MVRTLALRGLAGQIEKGAKFLGDLEGVDDFTFEFIV